jgi:hypothetical protein
VQHDAGTAPGTLDGSPARIKALLRELIELTGDDEGGMPALELRFGDILTRTALHAPDENALVVTAMLPPCGDGGYRPPHGQHMEFLWDADEGRYIGLRLVPIGSLPDERDVLDAILATADMAAAWLTALRRGA